MADGTCFNKTDVNTEAQRTMWIIFPFCQELQATAGFRYFITTGNSCKDVGGRDGQGSKEDWKKGEGEWRRETLERTQTEPSSKTSMMNDRSEG